MQYTIDGWYGIGKLMLIRSSHLFGQAGSYDSCPFFWEGGLLAIHHHVRPQQNVNLQTTTPRWFKVTSSSPSSRSLSHLKGSLNHSKKVTIAELPGTRFFYVMCQMCFLSMESSGTWSHWPLKPLLRVGSKKRHVFLSCWLFLGHLPPTS